MRKALPTPAVAAARDEAAVWQRKAINAARGEGLAGRLDEIGRVLASYERGNPCRP